MSFFGFGRKAIAEEDDDTARAAAQAAAREAELAAGFEEIKELYKSGTLITTLEQMFESSIVQQAVEAVHHEMLLAEEAEMGSSSSSDSDSEDSDESSSGSHSEEEEHDDVRPLPSSQQARLGETEEQRDNPRRRRSSGRRGSGGPVEETVTEHKDQNIKRRSSGGNEEAAADEGEHQDSKKKRRSSLEEKDETKTTPTILPAPQARASIPAPVVTSPMFPSMPQISPINPRPVPPRTPQEKKEKTRGIVSIPIDWKDSDVSSISDESYSASSPSSRSLVSSAQLSRNSDHNLGDSMHAQQRHPDQVTNRKPSVFGFLGSLVGANAGAAGEGKDGEQRRQEAVNQFASEAKIRQSMSEGMTVLALSELFHEQDIERVLAKMKEEEEFMKLVEQMAVAKAESDSSSSNSPHRGKQHSPSSQDQDNGDDGNDDDETRTAASGGLAGSVMSVIDQILKLHNAGAKRQVLDAIFHPEEVARALNESPPASSSSSSSGSSFARDDKFVPANDDDTFGKKLSRRKRLSMIREESERDASARLASLEDISESSSKSSVSGPSTGALGKPTLRNVKSARMTPDERMTTTEEQDDSSSSSSDSNLAALVQTNVSSPPAKDRSKAASISSPERTTSTPIQAEEAQAEIRRLLLEGVDVETIQQNYSMGDIKLAQFKMWVEVPTTSQAETSVQPLQSVPKSDSAPPKGVTVEESAPASAERHTKKQDLREIRRSIKPISEQILELHKSGKQQTMLEAIFGEDEVKRVLDEQTDAEGATERKPVDKDVRGSVKSVPEQIVELHKAGKKRFVLESIFGADEVARALKHPAGAVESKSDSHETSAMQDATEKGGYDTRGSIKPTGEQVPSEGSDRAALESIFHPDAVLKALDVSSSSGSSSSESKSGSSSSSESSSSASSVSAPPAFETQLARKKRLSMIVEMEDVSAMSSSRKEDRARLAPLEESEHSGTSAAKSLGDEVLPKSADSPSASQVAANESASVESNRDSVSSPTVPADNAPDATSRSNIEHGSPDHSDTSSSSSSSESASTATDATSNSSKGDRNVEDYDTDLKKSSSKPDEVASIQPALPSPAEPETQAFTEGSIIKALEARISSLERSVIHLEERNVALDNELTQAKDQLNLEQSNNALVGQKLKTAEGQVKTKTREVQEAEQMIEALENDKDALADEAREASVKCLLLENRAKQAEGRIKTKNRELEEAEQMIEVLETDKDAQSSELEELLAAKMSLTLDLDERAEALKKVQMQVDSLEQQNSTIALFNDELKEQVSALSNAQANLEEENNRLIEELKNAEQKASQLLEKANERCLGLEKDSARAAADYESLEKVHSDRAVSIAQLQEMLAVRESEMATASGNAEVLADLTKTIADLTGENAKLGNDLQELRGALRLKEDELTEAVRGRSQLEEQISLLKQEQLEALQEASDSSAGLQRVLDERAELENKLANSLAENASANQERSDITMSFYDARDNLASKEVEFAQESAALSAAQEKLAQLQNEESEYISKIDQLQRGLHDKERQLEASSSNNGKIQKELAEAVSGKNILLATKEELSQNIDKLENTLEEAETKLSTRDKELVEESQQALSAKDEELAELSDAMTTSKEDLSKLQQEQALTEAALGYMEAKLASQSAAAEALSENKAIGEQEQPKLQALVEEAQQALAGKEEELASQVALTEALAESKTAGEQEQSRLGALLGDAQKALAAKEDLSDFRQSLAAAQEDTSKLQQEKAVVEASLGELEAKLASQVATSEALVESKTAGEQEQSRLATLLENAQKALVVKEEQLVEALAASQKEVATLKQGKESAEATSGELERQLASQSLAYEELETSHVLLQEEEARLATLLEKTQRSLANSQEELASTTEVMRASMKDMKARLESDMTDKEALTATKLEAEEEQSRLATLLQETQQLLTAKEDKLVQLAQTSAASIKEAEASLASQLDFNTELQASVEALEKEQVILNTLVQNTQQALSKKEEELTKSVPDLAASGEQDPELQQNIVKSLETTSELQQRLAEATNKIRALEQDVAEKDRQLKSSKAETGATAEHVREVQEGNAGTVDHDPLYGPREPGEVPPEEQQGGRAGRKKFVSKDQRLKTLEASVHEQDVQLQQTLVEMQVLDSEKRSLEKKIQLQDEELQEIWQELEAQGLMAQGLMAQDKPGEAGPATATVSRGIGATEAAARSIPGEEFAVSSEAAEVAGDAGERGIQQGDSASLDAAPDETTGRRRLQELEEQLADATSQLGGVGLEKSALEEKLVGVEQEKAALENKLEQYHDIEKSKLALDEEVKSAQSTVRELGFKLESTEKFLADIAQEKVVLENKVEEYHEIEKEKLALEEEMKYSQSTVDELSHKVENLEDNVAALIVEKESHLHAVEELTVEKESVTAEQEVTLGRLEELQMKYTSLQDAMFAADNDRIDLKNQLEALQAQSSELLSANREMENQELLSKQSIVEEELDNAKDQLLALRKELSNHQASKESTEDELGAAYDTIDCLKVSANDIFEDLENLEADLIEVKDANLSANRFIAKTQAELEELQRNVVESQEVAAAGENQIADLILARDEAVKQRQVTGGRLRTLLSDNTKLQTRLSQLQTQFEDAFETSQSREKAALESGKEEIERLRQEILMLGRNKEKDDDHLSVVLKELAALRTLHADMEASMVAKDEEGKKRSLEFEASKSLLEEQLEIEREKITELEASILAFESAIEHLRIENRSRAAQLSEQKKMKELAEEKSEKDTASKVALSQENTRVQGELDAATLSLEKSVEGNKALESKIDEYQALLPQLETDLSEARLHLKNLASEDDKLKAEVVEASSRAVAVSAELKDAEGRCASLETKMSLQESARQQLLEELALLRDELEETRRVKLKLKKELDERRKKVKELEASLEKATNKTEKAQSQSAKLEERYSQELLDLNMEKGTLQARLEEIDSALQESKDALSKSTKLVEKYRTMVTEIDMEVSDARDENETLAKKSDEKGRKDAKELKKLRLERDELESHIEKMGAELHESQQATSEAKVLADKYSRLVTRLEIDVHGLQRELDVQKVDRDLPTGVDRGLGGTAEPKMETLRAELLKLRTATLVSDRQSRETIEKLRAELTSVKQEMDNALKEQRSLGKELEQANREAAALTSARDELQLQRKNANDIQETIRSDLERERKENLALLKQLASVEGTPGGQRQLSDINQTLADAVKAASDDKHLLARQVEDLKKEAVDLQIKAKLIDLEYPDLKKQIRGLEEKCEENKSSLRRARRKLDRAKDENKELEAALDKSFLQLEKANIERESALASLKAGEETAKSHSQERSSAIQSKEREMEALRAKLSRVERRATENEQKLRKAEKKLQMLTVDSRTKEEASLKETEALKTRALLLEGRSMGLQEAYNDVAARRDHLETQLTAAETELARMKTVVNKTRTIDQDASREEVSDKAKSEEVSDRASRLELELTRVSLNRDALIEELKKCQLDLRMTESKIPDLQASLGQYVSKMTTGRQLLATILKSTTSAVELGKRRRTEKFSSENDLVDLITQVKLVLENTLDSREKTQQKLEEATFYCEGLRKTAQEKNSSLIELRSTFMSEKKALMAELLELEGMVGEFGSDNKETLRQLKKQLNDTKKEHGNLKTELARSSRTQMALTVASESLEKSLGDALAETKQLKDKLANQQSTADEIVGVKARNESLSELLEQARDEISKLKELIANPSMKSKETLDLDERIKSLQTELDNALADVETFKRSRDEMRRLVRQAGAEKDKELKESLDKLRAFDTQKEALVTSLESAYMERDKAITQKEALVTSLESAYTERDEANKLKDRYKKNLEQAKTSFASLKENVAMFDIETDQMQHVVRSQSENDGASHQLHLESWPIERSTSEQSLDATENKPLPMIPPAEKRQKIAGPSSLQIHPRLVPESSRTERFISSGRGRDAPDTTNAERPLSSFQHRSSDTDISVHNQADEPPRPNRHHQPSRGRVNPPTSTSRRSPFVTFQEPIHTSSSQYYSGRFSDRMVRSSPFHYDSSHASLPPIEPRASTSPSSFRSNRIAAQQPNPGRPSLRSSRSAGRQLPSTRPAASLSPPPPPPPRSTFALPQRPRTPNPITLALESICDPPARTSAGNFREAYETSVPQDRLSRLDRVRWS